METKSNLTPTNIKALKLLKGGRIDTPLSEIGWLLYPEGSGGRKAQGMARAAANAMHNVVKKGLVRRFIGERNYVFNLTNEGYEALRQHSEEVS